jgi:cold shock CspA family protein
MRLNGILRSWNDDRGFGFIAPTHGGAELFVHASAFPRDGSRPVPGESLTYELGRGANGKPQAVSVVRSAVGRRRPSPAQPRPRARRRLPKTLVLMIAVLCVAYAYERLGTRFPTTHPPEAVAERAPSASPSPFRCDGRTHCSQMTSCAEATYFLRNCPGVRMDGDHDGVPCEQQWCR